MFCAMRTGELAVALDLALLAEDAGEDALGFCSKSGVRFAACYPGSRHGCNVGRCRAKADAVKRGAE